MAAPVCVGQGGADSLRGNELALCKSRFPAHCRFVLLPGKNTAFSWPPASWIIGMW